VSDDERWPLDPDELPEPADGPLWDPDEYEGLAEDDERP
jgi:hypothetical protein